MPAPVATTIYRYTDAKGALHLVDGLNTVPPAFRAKAVPVAGELPVEVVPISKGVSDEVDLRALQARAAAHASLRHVEGTLHELGWAYDVHLPSVGLGAGSVLALLLAWTIVRRRPRLVLRFVTLATLLATMSLGYLSWIRTATGLGAGVATPQSLVDEARRTKALMDEQTRERRRMLDDIAREGAPLPQ